MNSEKPVVSIVISARGGEFSALERACFSVFGSDYPQKEVLLVYPQTDPGFREKLEAVTRPYPELNFKLLPHPEGKGLGSDYNLGVKNASGRYLGFLREDEVLYPNHLEGVIERLEAENRAWGFGYAVTDLEENGYLAQKIRPPLREEFYFKLLWERDYLPLASAVIDREKAGELPGFREDLSRACGHIFLAELSARHQPAVYPQHSLARKRELPGEASRRNRKTAPERLDFGPEQPRVEELKREIAGRHFWIRELEKLQILPYGEERIRRVFLMGSRLTGKKITVTLNLYD